MRPALVLALAVEAAQLAAQGREYASFLTHELRDVYGSDVAVGLTTWRFGTDPLLDIEITTSGCESVPDLVGQRSQGLSGPDPRLAKLFQCNTREPVRVSDVVPLRSFWGTPLYNCLVGPADGQYAAAAPLHIERGEIIFLGISRRHRDLSNTDLVDLAAVQRPLAKALAYRSALDSAVAELQAVSAQSLSRPQLHTSPSGHLSIAAALCQDFRPSRREAEVLSLVTAGWTDRQIASRLGITERTVRKHLTNVFDKAGVRGRAAAAAWWQRTRHQPERTRPTRSKLST